MKYLVTTIAITSTLIFAGCSKTKNATIATLQPTEMEVDVEVDSGEIIVLVNGEEQTIDISEIMGDIDLDVTDGEMSIAIMAVADEESIQLMKWGNGKEMPHPQMRNRMMHLQGGPPEDRDGMREYVAHIRSGYGKNLHGERLGEHPHGEQDGSEIREFMHELELFRGASHSLDDSNAVAMLGIQMIRDELEGEARMAALETIIEDGAMGSSSRNAALIVAIQTLKEEGNDQAAADYMVELVLSN